MNDTLSNHDAQEYIASVLMPKTNKFMAHKPFPKQLAFWMLPQREALFGGSLGGGKSDVLLMIGLENVSIPNYAGYIFRLTLEDHKLPGAPLDRLSEWLAPFIKEKAVKYVGSEHAFHFRTYNKQGKEMPVSKLRCCYIGQQNAYLRYQGSEISFCGFDEVAQHAERDYTYMFSRLRTPLCPKHAKKDKQGYPIYDPDCEMCDWVRRTPMRMRSTCNPDGPGFAWVKKRFDIRPNMSEDEAQLLGEDVKWIGHNKERPFVPSFFTDNPYINHVEYGNNLRETLSADLYEALVKGSWGVTPHAKFKRRWRRYYSREGKHLWLGPERTGRILDLTQDVQLVFQTIDSASTLMEGPGDTDLFPTRAKSPSSSVISTWILTSCYNLLWLNMVQDRCEIPELIKLMEEQYKIYSPRYAVVEENGIGRGVAQFAARAGMQIEGVTATKDKLVNATEAIMRMEQGRIWLPQYASWLEEAEDQVFTWQGYEKEPDDIIDTLSHACNHVDWSGVPPMEGFVQAYEQPTVIESAPGAYYAPDAVRLDRGMGGLG